jgi:hypothetical protein
LQKADPKLVYAAQVRAARALLGWSQGDLAERACAVAMRRSTACRLISCA